VISTTDSISPSRRRRLVTLAVALPLVFLVSGCSSGTSSAESPAANEVQFTSASGLLTINVPKTWTENTVQAQALADAMEGNDLRVEGCWLLPGASLFTGSAITIATFPIGGVPDEHRATVVNEMFTQIAQMYGGATAPYSTMTTRDGLSFERGDFAVSASNGNTATMIALISFVDGRLIQISISFLNDDVAFEDDVIHAVETLVVN